MFSYLSVAALAAAALPFASADACNPIKQSNCPIDAGLTKAFSTDFTTGNTSLVHWNPAIGTNLNFTSDGAEFVITKGTDAPLVQTDFYIHFGTVEVKAKMAKGLGIITSIVLMSDDFDEADWEALGHDTTSIQTNYFGKGNATTWDRGAVSPTNDNQNNFITYKWNWTPDTLTWLINDQVVRTLNKADAVDGKNYPQTPARISLGMWSAGDPSQQQGTIDWAGGETDYTQGPFKMVVQSVKITNANPACAYNYTDMSGDASSIKQLNDAQHCPKPSSVPTTTSFATLTDAPMATQLMPGANSTRNHTHYGNYSLPTPHTKIMTTTYFESACSCTKTSVLTTTSAPTPWGTPFVVRPVADTTLTSIVHATTTVCPSSLAGTAASNSAGTGMVYPTQNGTFAWPSSYARTTQPTSSVAPIVTSSPSSVPTASSIVPAVSAAAAALSSLNAAQSSLASSAAIPASSAISPVSSAVSPASSAVSPVSSAVAAGASSQPSTLSTPTSAATSSAAAAALSALSSQGPSQQGLGAVPSSTIATTMSSTITTTRYSTVYATGASSMLNAMSSFAPTLQAGQCAAPTAPTTVFVTVTAGSTPTSSPPSSSVAPLATSTPYANSTVSAAPLSTANATLPANVTMPQNGTFTPTPTLSKSFTGGAATVGASALPVALLFGVMAFFL